MRLAVDEPVLLFIDEANRVPKKHTNLLLTLMNPKPGDFCRQQGLDVVGPGPFYVVETPMTSEVVWCPGTCVSWLPATSGGRMRS
jgi:hypothetical protein